MKLDIVIPAYNEENTIEDVVTRLKYFGNVIVVNDASTDKTASILKKLHIPVLTNKTNMGHAKSVIRGLTHAKGDFIMYLDADNQIKPFNFDVILGYRVHRQDKFFRKVVSFILRMIILLRHRMWIRDANCPFKVFNHFTLNFLLFELPKNSIVPSIDLAILAKRYNFNVLQIPVDHYPYENRKGFLQSMNRKSLSMFWNACKEVWNL